MKRCKRTIFGHFMSSNRHWLESGLLDLATYNRQRHGPWQRHNAGSRGNAWRNLLRRHNKRYGYFRGELLPQPDDRRPRHGHRRKI